MKKVLKLEDLCCANCAAIIEREVAAIDGVKSANVSFVMQNMTFECDEQNLDDIMKKIRKVVKKIEPDCEIGE